MIHHNTAPMITDLCLSLYHAKTGFEKRNEWHASMHFLDKQNNNQWRNGTGNLSKSRK